MTMMMMLERMASMGWQWWQQKQKGNDQQ